MKVFVCTFGLALALLVGLSTAGCGQSDREEGQLEKPKLEAACPDGIKAITDYIAGGHASDGFVVVCESGEIAVIDVDMG